MNIHSVDPFAPRSDQDTPEGVFWNRRRWLQAAGVGAAAAGLGWFYASPGSEAAVLNAGRWSPEDERLAASHVFPRDESFVYNRTETTRVAAASYTNFYEFSFFKSTWRYIRDFEPAPWTISVGGLCRNPQTWDLDEFYRQFADHFVERRYRHRCVERWAMAVPWSGFPLAALLKSADPLPSATHIKFVSFDRPAEAPKQRDRTGMPWPYTEGLTLPEANNPLTMLATGVYGRPLLKQHGAPLRLVVPWKYGYKSIKSISHFEFVDRRPATFWSTVNPAAYPFESNVDPLIARPWNQASERMLGTGETIPTQKYNGYGEYVAALYE